jgi:small-conductance mechanosensitive channel
MWQHPFFESPLFGIILLVVFITVLTAAKKLLFRSLKKFAAKTKSKWDDVIVHALGFPMTLVVVAIGMGFLKQFPHFTQGYDSPVSITAQILLVLGVTLFADRILLGFFHEYTQRNEEVRSYRGIVGLGIRFVIGALGLLILLDLLGVSITPLIASLGVGSLAVALALQDTLANFFGGVYLLMDRPIQVNHYVKLSTGEEGYVEHVGWRSIRIRNLRGNMIILPNSTVAGAILTNFNLPQPSMTVLVSVGVHYDSDLYYVETVACDVAKEVMEAEPGAVKSFNPFIFYTGFADSSINFNVVLGISDYEKQFLVKSAFIKLLSKRFREENIEIPYPMRSVYMRDAEKEAKTRLKLEAKRTEQKKSLQKNKGDDLYDKTVLAVSDDKYDKTVRVHVDDLADKGSSK